VYIEKWKGRFISNNVLICTVYADSSYTSNVIMMCKVKLHHFR